MKLVVQHQTMSALLLAISISLLGCGTSNADSAGESPRNTTAAAGGSTSSAVASGGAAVQSGGSTPRGLGGTRSIGDSTSPAKSSVSPDASGGTGQATGDTQPIIISGGTTQTTRASGGTTQSILGGAPAASGGTTQTTRASGGTTQSILGGAPAASGGLVGVAGGAALAAGGVAGGKSSTSQPVAMAGANSMLPPTNDYAAPGPFATTTDNNVGPDGKCTAFRPKTLGQNGFLHAPIVFGPGIGMQATQLKDLLLSFASHGFVVIGTGVLEGGPNDPDNLAAMQKALEWIILQNSQPGTYQGKLDVKHAISMGYSVGGTAAVELGGHEAIATTVSIHGHVASANLHGPMLQTSGTKDTVGLPMQQKTFDGSKVQTFLGTVTNADHGYIQSNSGGVERVAIVAWLRYWIYGDTGARPYFWGDDCVLCKSPWTNPQRKNWQ